MVDVVVAPENTLHIYTRVSTAVQADEGMSLDFQAEIGVKRAKDLGFKHILWNEGGKSSNHEEIDKRPILSQVYNKILSGEIKHLFVYDQSRLSRNDGVSSAFRVACNRNGVTLYTKDGTYDLSNSTDQFMKKIMDAVAELDNAQRAERSRLGKLARVKQGHWLGGPPPFGYSVEKKHLVVNKDEAQWVKRIFTEYANQTPTIDIKVLLDSNGVKPRRGGKGWAIGSIQALLRNTHYLGFWEYNDKRSGESVQVECPRILPSALWKKVEATKNRNKAKRASENPQKHFYMLTGVIRCAHCGKLMSGETRSSVGKQVYYCPKKLRDWVKTKIADEDKWKRGRVCQMTRSLNLPETDEIVWNAVIDVMSKSVILKEQVKSKTFEEFGKARLDDSQMNAAKLKIKALHKQITKLNEALALVETNRILERLSAEQYPLIKANITDERTSLEAQVEQLQDEIDGVARHQKWIDWVETYKSQIASQKKFTPQQKRSLLEGMLASVDVRLLDTKTHQLTINFQLPIVNDSIEYKSKGKKSGPYVVHEGTRSLTLDPLSGVGSKKKDV
jgi:DNA invertase Pin-like site-specific DNA recombinase